jgi:ABC-type uncharacterized transport system auxiliary subunit
MTDSGVPPAWTRWSIWSAALALALVLALAACSQPPVPRDQFYRLSGGVPTTRHDPAPLDGSLGVVRLRADGLVTQRPILFTSRERPNRLEQHSYNYWVESPPLMLRDALVDYLREAGAATSVTVGEARRATGCELTGTLRRMEQITAGGEPSTALIEIEFMLERANDRTVLLHRTYRAEQVAADLTVDATATAFNSVLGALFARLVADLAAHPAACPSPVR